MNAIRHLLNRFRAWRLNTWANQLLDEALYHREQERRTAAADASEKRYHHSAEIAFRTRAREVRQLARRVEAARG